MSSSRSAADSTRLAAPVPFAEFNELYQEIVRTVLGHWSPSMQQRMAEHNVAWAPGKFDFREYLEDSSIRFYQAYRFLAQTRAPRSQAQFGNEEKSASSATSVGDAHPTPSPKVGDIGGFWGVFPLALRELGYDVVMTEALKYYSRSFDPIFNLISRRGVKIVDYDPFDEGAELPLKFDFVTVMAVLEHYPHSLKPFMENVTSTLAAGGRLYLEVPNIAALSRRFALLRGRTPHPPVADIYHSRIPFIGHHHEYTMAELYDLASLCGLRVIEDLYYNYSRQRTAGLIRRTRDALRSLICRAIPSCRECVAVLCERAAEPAAGRIAA